MALYPYVATLAVDPVTLVKAAGATGVIYAPEDTSFASPLIATDASGNPIPLTANADGILPSFYATSPAVNWRSGSYVFPLVTSQPLEGPKGDKGEDGQNGSNTVPTAQAIAAEMQTPGTPANTALSEAIENAIAVSKRSGEINMLDAVGGVNDGNTDHHATLTAIIDALTAEPNASGACPIIYFPRGRWTLSGSYANSSTKRFSIRGDGPLATIIRRPAGATGDLFTLNATNTIVQGMCIEGGRYQGVVGDSVVLNGAYTHCADMQFNKSGGSALVIGKGGIAIAHVLNNLHFRENAQYGIWTVGGSGSTDGMWSNIEVGNSGRYGVRLGTGAQNISNLHVWGSGLESTTERDGIFFEAGSNSLTAWQSEKNLGRGVRIESINNVLTGGRAWGNCFGAVYILNGMYNNVVGNVFHQNSVNNVAGTTATSLGVVFLEGTSIRNSITGNIFWDNTTDLTPGNYVTAPTYPYPGRSGSIRTHTLLITEGGATDFNLYAANLAQRELTRANSTTMPYVFVGLNNRIAEDNDWGGVGATQRTVTGGAVRVPPESDTIVIAVSQEVTSVLGGRPGRVARLIFTNVAPSPVRDNGGTLNLNGDFTPTTNDVLTLVSDGTNWYEVSRSTN